MRLLPQSNLNIIKVCQVCGRSIDDDDARCWMSGGRTEFGSPCREIVKVPNFRQFGFSAKRDRFVEVCWGGPRLPRALLIRGGLSESDTAIMLGQHLPMYNTMCSKLIEWWYDLELCEQIMLIHCWYNSDGANLPVRHLPICSIPTNNFLPEPSTRALYVTIRHYY